MDKILKNPKIMGWIAIITMVVVVLSVVDNARNPKRDFFGLLKTSTPTE